MQATVFSLCTPVGGMCWYLYLHGHALLMGETKVPQYLAATVRVSAGERRHFHLSRRA